MKRHLFYTLALLLIVSLLSAGCQTTPAEQSSAPETTNSPTAPAETKTAGNDQSKDGFAADANTFPIVDSPVTLSVLALTAPAQVSDWDDNRVTEYWETKTGVHLDWEIVIDSGASAQKLGVVMASKDMPDFIMGYFSFDQVVSYGSQGLIVALNELVDQYGVNTKAMYDVYPELEKSLSAPDGNMYYIPSYSAQEYSHGACLQKCLINTKWLENLNLEIPKTTEEFYDVLVAFRDNDANGNGDPSDEIPLAAPAGSYESYLMNGFQYNSMNNRLMVENDVVKACYTEDGWREGLRFMRKLYAEDLVDKEIFIADSNQLMLYTGDAKGNRVGSIFTFAYSMAMDISTGIVNEFAFIEPLTGPAGLRQSPYTPHYLVPAMIITADCDMPDVAFRWGDAKLADPFADPALEALDGEYGPENEGWVRAKEGELGISGEPALYNWKFTWGDVINLHWYEYGPNYYGAERKLAMVADLSTWNQEVELYNATMKLYKPYAVDKNVPDALMFEPDIVGEVAQLKGTINTYVTDSISKFVTGTMDLDSDWDSYLQELNTMGLPRLLQLYQEAYDVQYKD